MVEECQQGWTAIDLHTWENMCEKRYREAEDLEIAVMLFHTIVYAENREPAEVKLLCMNGSSVLRSDKLIAYYDGVCRIGCIFAYKGKENPFGEKLCDIYNNTIYVTNTGRPILTKAVYNKIVEFGGYCFAYNVI